jgi:hypothetical protein
MQYSKIDNKKQFCFKFRIEFYALPLFSKFSRLPKTIILGEKYHISQLSTCMLCVVVVVVVEEVAINPKLNSCVFLISRL